MFIYDLIVIGVGFGGYVCVICVVQLGLKVVCVEGCEMLGGICLNVGCIFLKVMFYVSYMLYEMYENFEKMGLMGVYVEVDWVKMLGYKVEIVGMNIKGIEFLFKKNKIDWLKGWVSIEVVGKVKVGEIVYEIKNIVIVLGLVLLLLKGVEVDNVGGVVVDSIGVLELLKIFKLMVVIGVGVIGFEFGLVYVCLGVEVMVVEYLDVIIFGMDGEV